MDSVRQLPSTLQPNSYLTASEQRFQRGCRSPMRLFTVDPRCSIARKRSSKKLYAKSLPFRNSRNCGLKGSKNEEARLFPQHHARSTVARVADFRDQGSRAGSTDSEPGNRADARLSCRLLRRVLSRSYRCVEAGRPRFSAEAG